MLNWRSDYTVSITQIRTFMEHLSEAQPSQLLFYRNRLLGLIHWSFLEQYLMLLCSSSCEETNCQFAFCFSSSGVCHLDFAVVRHCNPLLCFPVFSCFYWPREHCIVQRLSEKYNYCDLLLVCGPRHAFMWHTAALYSSSLWYTSDLCSFAACS